MSRGRGRRLRGRLRGSAGSGRGIGGPRWRCSACAGGEGEGEGEGGGWSGKRSCRGTRWMVAGVDGRVRAGEVVVVVVVAVVVVVVDAGRTWLWRGRAWATYRISLSSEDGGLKHSAVGPSSIPGGRGVDLTCACVGMWAKGGCPRAERLLRVAVAAHWVNVSG